jgi:phosphatidate cytidylyltransferase
MAYLGGRLVGGPKLWPRVSPGKTWSGAIIGALAAAAIGAAVAALASPTPVKSLDMALVGLIVSVAAQAGDLFESALKRRAGVKDSSGLIPGHGGLMDRLDSFIVAVALTAAIGYARASGQWIAAGLFQW